MEKIGGDYIEKITVTVSILLLVLIFITGFDDVTTYEPVYATEEDFEWVEPQQTKTDTKNEFLPIIKERKKKKRKWQKYLITAYCPCCDC